MGTVTLSNISDQTISEIELMINIKVYMDTPKVNAESVSLEPGETKKISIYALFNSSVLEITEATKLQRK
ncbi:MAG: hypothetical protein U5P10_13565 [Spirochaetia bacterium]|nr:hypothetical protein [Spirochaetia bacterium]